jgi:hypothetical protein
LPERQRGSGRRKRLRPGTQAEAQPRHDEATPPQGLARLPGRHGIQQLQQSLGNFAVRRMLTTRVQRQGPFGGRQRPSLLGGDSQLTLDPDIEAQMRAITAMRLGLSPDALRPALLQLPDNFVQPPGPLDSPPTPAAPPLVPAGAGPSAPRAASGGDVLRAVMAIPAVDTAITNLQNRAVERVQRDWRSLGTGGQVAVVSSLAVIGGGALAGAMTDPDAREFGLSQLNGRVIPVPGVGGLGVELNTQGDNVMVGLHLDIGRYLPESLGFGAGSPSAIGAPPMSRKVAEPEAGEAREQAAEHGTPEPVPPLHIHRQPPTAPTAAATWRPPFEAPVVTSREDAREAVLWACWAPLHNLSAQLEHAELEEPEELGLAVQEAGSWAQVLQGEGDISAHEAEQLAWFGRDVTRIHDHNLGRLKDVTRGPLEHIANQPAPDTTAQENALAEQLHFAFIDGDTDQIGVVRDALDKLKGYVDSVNDVLTWANRTASLIGSATTLARLERATGGASAVSDALEKVTAVATTARAVATLSGLDNQAVGPAQNRIRQFEASIELIDVGFTFFKAVPVLGQLWSNYYLPITRECIRLLGIIARYQDVEGRQYGLLEFWQQQHRGQRRHDQGPTLPSHLLEYFPGGQPVLDFMYGIMHDREPRPSSPVRAYFLEHRELFNAGRQTRGGLESESTSSWYDPTTWGDERLSTDLTPWVQRNRSRVWAMLYGDLPSNL